MKAEVRHQRLEDRVFDRLIEKDHEVLVESFVYPHGELDVMAIDGNVITYYEVKGSDHKAGYGRALKQFSKFMAEIRNPHGYFAQIDLPVDKPLKGRCVYVTQDSMCRMHVKRVRNFDRRKK